MDACVARVGWGVGGGWGGVAQLRNWLAAAALVGRRLVVLVQGQLQLLGLRGRQLQQAAHHRTTRCCCSHSTLLRRPSVRKYVWRPSGDVSMRFITPGGRSIVPPPTRRRQAGCGCGGVSVGGAPGLRATCRCCCSHSSAAVDEVHAWRPLKRAAQFEGCGIGGGVRGAPWSRASCGLPLLRPTDTRAHRIWVEASVRPQDVWRPSPRRLMSAHTWRPLNRVAQSCRSKKSRVRDWGWRARRTLESSILRYGR